MTYLEIQRERFDRGLAWLCGSMLVFGFIGLQITRGGF